MEPVLPPRNKIAYGLANMANSSLSGIALGGALTFFYQIKLGLDYNLISLAWLLFAGWNAINDPLIGIIEDKTRSKIGRHIPYIRYGAPLYGILFILTWFPWWEGQMGLFFNLLLTLFLVDTLFSMIGLVIYGLPAEMAFTAKNRANLLLWSTFISAIGTVISYALPIFLLTGDRSPILDPLFRPVMIVLGIACTILLWGSSYYLKENEFAQMEEPLGFIPAIKETFKNKPFTILEVSLFTVTLAQNTFTASIFYVIDYVLQLEDLSDYLALLPLAVAFVGGVFLTQRLVVKYGAKKTYTFGLLLTGGGLVVTAFTGYTIIAAVIPLCVAILGLAATTLTNQAVMGDCIDFDEVQTGKRRETTYSGVNALITKPAISLATALFLVIAGAYGFDADLSVQVPTAATGIIYGFALVPGILLIISGVMMRWFRLDGPAWMKQKKELAKIHHQKEQDYLKFLKEKGGER